MCSYQNTSNANQRHLNESWEKELWASVFPELIGSNATENCSGPYQCSEPPAVPIFTGRNESFKTTVQDSQMQISTTYQNSESSSSASPTWDCSGFEVPQNTTNMSTYFSTFNPSTQFQQNSMHQNLVMKTTSNVKTQNDNGKGKMHYARINFVPSANGSFKAIVKRKRKRIVFTTEQLEVLETVFTKKPYVTRDERQLLVQQLQVNDKSIKVWFQNRRLKNKKGDDQYEVMVADSTSTIFERLDNVEAHIKERTDEFGYVTLDDQITSELVSVIDDYFTSNVSHVQKTPESDYSPIYEPISPASPASNNSCDENSTPWQCCDPNNSVQNIVDLESLILT